MSEKRQMIVRRVGVAAVVSVLFAIGAAACGTPKSAGPSAATTTTRGTASTSTAPSEVPLAVSLTVVVCPTTYGISTPPLTAPLPKTMQVAVRPALAGKLAFYTDTLGRMKLLAPSGWSCRGEYGADGSGGVAAYPAGQPLSSNAFGAGWSLSPTSGIEAVVGSETSACAGCTLGQACRLFPTAATAYQNTFGQACPERRPATEKTTQLVSGVMSFVDPTGVTGDGSPSGGTYPADGVMTYQPGAPSGSWLDTCTLPAFDTALCTEVLHEFVVLYGSD